MYLILLQTLKIAFLKCVLTTETKIPLKILVLNSYSLHSYVHRSGLLNKREIVYSGKLLRDKALVNFVASWVFVKVFSAKFGSVASFVAAKASNPQTFSP